MKHSLPVFLLLLLLLAGCSREDRAFVAMLDRADSLIQTHPDSALALLDAAGSQEAKESSSQGVRKTSLSMRYRLLRVKAEDKLYKPITGYESLVIDTLVPYFRKHGTPYLNATALFYAGRICTDKGDAPQAIDYYQQTLNALPRKHNPAFRALIYNQIGTLFYYQELFEEAYYHYHQAYLSDSIGNDTTGMIYDLRDIGNTLHLQKKWDSAIIYYNNAIKLAELSKNRNMYLDVTGQVANLYLSKGDYERVIHLMQPVIEELDSANISPNYFILSNAYYQAHQQDSAVYYYNKLLQYGNVYGKQSAFLHLSEIALKNKKINIFKQLHDSLRYYDDSIKYLNNATTIARMHSLYNYQLREKQAIDEKEKKEEARQMVFFLSMLALLLLLSVIALWQYAQKRKLRYMRRLDVLEKIREHSLEEIEKKELQIHHLEFQVEETLQQINNLAKQESEQQDKDKEIDSLFKENECLRNKIKDLNIDIEFLHSLRKKNDDAVHRIKATNIYQKLFVLLESPDTMMRKEDWKQLSDVTDQQAPSFRKNLQSLLIPSDSEYKICVLLKLDVPQAKIGRLISMTPSGVTHACQRLYKKIKGEKGSVDDLIMLLKDL